MPQNSKRSEGLPVMNKLNTAKMMGYDTNMT